MGTTFCNISVHCDDLSAVEAACPGKTVRALTSGWITVVGENLGFDNTEEMAARLSETLPYPVLSTEFFDDDYAVFTLFCGGKKTAQHIPAEYEGEPRIPGDSRRWAGELGLSDKQEKILQIIFEETIAGVSLGLLECVLGCCLWVDPEFITDAKAPDRSYLDGYLKRREERIKLESSLHNAFRLELSDELEGTFMQQLDDLLVLNEGRDGVKSFWKIEDGAFVKLFEAEIPESSAAGRIQCRLEDRFLISYSKKDVWPPEYTAHVFSEKGERLFTLPVENPVLSNAYFPERDRVVVNNACWNIQRREKEWTMAEVPRGFQSWEYGHLKGRLITTYDDAKDWNKSYLISTLPDGSAPVSREIPRVYHWNTPVIWNGGVLLGVDRELFFFDASLNPVWQAETERKNTTTTGVFLDAEAQMLYLSDIESFSVFDLKERRITALRKRYFEEQYYFSGVLPGRGMIVTSGESPIQIWNSKLEPVSMHSIKGFLRGVIDEGGKTFILSLEIGTGNVGASEPGGIPGKIRLYELKPEDHSNGV